MTSVCFLDFDGVFVNTLTTMLLKRVVDPTAVALIDQALSKTDCKIVVSSTWRLGESSLQLSSYLRLSGFQAQLHEDAATVRCRSSFRGDEIDEWLSRHPEITEYVVIDDDSDFHLHQIPHFVHVDYRTGFTAVDYHKVLRVLHHDTDIHMIRPFGPRDYTRSVESYRDWYDQKEKDSLKSS